MTNKLGSIVSVKGADANTDFSEFDAGDNIMTQIEQDGDGNSTIRVALANDLNVDSVTAGNSVLDNTGLTINDTTAGTLTSIGSGAIALADSTGNITTIDPTSVTVGGSFPIAISGTIGRASCRERVCKYV